MIEASVGVFVLLLLIIAGIEALQVGYFCLVGQRAVNEAARWATYGKLLPGQTTRLGSVKAVVRQQASQFGLDIDTSQIRICPGMNPIAACDVESELSSHALFTIEVVHPRRTILLKPLTIDLRFRAVAQNEPF